MNLLGFEFGDVNNTVIMLGIVIAAVFIMAAAYIVFDINGRYPLVNFRVNEGGIKRNRIYRLMSQRVIIRNELLPILFNHANIMGDDISRFRQEDEVNDKGQYRKIYLATNIGGQLIPDTEAITQKEAIDGKQLGARYKTVMRDAKELTDQADPLKSEIIKVIPVAVLLFIFGMIALSIYNSANDTYKQVSVINAQASADAKTASINLNLLADRLGVPKANVTANATSNSTVH